MTPVRAALVWAALALAIAVPLAAAAASPLLEWRGPVYAAAGFAGVALLGLVLLQPLLIGGYLPALSANRRRQAHLWIGRALVVTVVVHVVGLWTVSPPDMMDALLFSSPTPFSPFGVVAMWAIFAVALLVAFRRRLGLRPRTWRAAHTVLAAIIVGGGLVHAMLIEGTMEPVSKTILCALVLLATVKVIADRRVWKRGGAARAKVPQA